MKSRAVRVILLVLFAGIVGGGAYAMWAGEARMSAAMSGGRAFDARMRVASRLLLDVRSAQAGYVAAGQGEDFWASRVDALLGSVREVVPTLRADAHSAHARTEIDDAAAGLEDFEQMDRRARDYVRGGQRLLASDLVFADGIQRLDGVLAALERAREHEAGLRDAVVREGRRAGWIAAAGAAAGGLLIALALVPLPHEGRLPPARSAATSRERSGLDAAAARSAERRSEPAGDLPMRDAPPPEPRRSPLPAVEPAARAAAPSEPPASSPAPPQAPVSQVDLAGVAAVCTELSRVLDTRDLPAALAHAAALLEASGIVIWIADPDGRELSAVVAHGYPDHLLVRMGNIPRDAENATAAAFRTGLVQSVAAEGPSPGAIAAPLLSPAGPVGVMAAEVLNGREQQDAVRAVAAILAAQLATLMGPPSARSKGEAARA